MQDFRKLKELKEKVFALSMEIEDLADSIGYPIKHDILEVSAIIQEQCDELDEILKRYIVE